MKLIDRKYLKPLNGKTPQWFRDWYAMEFVPYKVRQDIIIVLASGTFIAVLVKFIVG